MNRRCTILVCALVVFGFWLRLAPVRATLPHRIVHDEYYHLHALELMRGDPDVARREPLYANYPHLVPRLAWLVAPDPPEIVRGSLDGQLETASRDALLLRRICAALSALVVPATFLLARRFQDGRTALVATAWIATSLLSVWYGSQARPHGPGAALGLLTVVAAIELRRNPTLRSYVLAGAAAGAALGALQTGLAVLPALGVAHVLRDRSRPGSALLRIAAACAPILVSVALFCPSWYGTESSFLVPVGLETGLFAGRGVTQLLLGLWHFEPVMLVLVTGLAVVSLVRLPRRWARGGKSLDDRGAPRSETPRLLRGREDLAVVLSHALPYGVAIALYETTAQRYFLPLLPYAAGLAAAVVVRTSDLCARAVPNGSARRSVALSLLLGWIGLQSITAVWLDVVRLAPDTAARAARWIEANVDSAGETILLQPNVDVPLLRTPDAMRGDPYVAAGLTPWATYQARLGDAPRETNVWRLRSMPMSVADRAAIAVDPVRYAHELDADYAIVELSEKAFVARVVEGVRGSGKLVARFSPMRTDLGDDTPFLWWDHPTDYGGAISWIRQLVRARSLGGVIEVYRLDVVPPD